MIHATTLSGSASASIGVFTKSYRFSALRFLRNTPFCRPFTRLIPNSMNSKILTSWFYSTSNRTLVVPAHEQVDCADWNTVAFFEAAEVPDVTRCLQLGADLEARGENGLNPLHWAAMVGCDEVVMALLEAGANPAARDKDYKLPADYAEDNEQIKGTDALRRLNDVRFQ